MNIVNLRGRELHREYKRRYQVSKVTDYLNSRSDRVCVLYGLRRTGKTTIIEHSIAELLDSGISESEILFITCELNDTATMGDIYNLIDKSNTKYIFIDEIAYISDFIERAALLYDIYSRGQNKRIVIAGTNLSSIFVSTLTTLFDRTLKIPVEHLTFYEHCKFVLETDKPEFSDFTHYLMHGGLYASDAQYTEYVQSSIINHLDDTLHTASAKQIYSWVSTSKFDKIGWGGVLNNIGLYSAGNMSNVNITTRNSLNEDYRHVKAALSRDIDREVLSELSEYLGLGSILRGSMKKDEVIGLLDFLVSCGF